MIVTAAVLGVVLTSIVTANPTGTVAQVPPRAAEASMPPAASETSRPGPEMSAHRPRIAAEPSVTPVASDAPAPEPAPETPAVLAPQPAPAIQLVGLPALVVDVWNAEERYFPVVGSTPGEIVASATAGVPADPTGMERTNMAYAGPIVWDHRPSYVQDPATGTCTMTGIASTVAYQATLPQWTAPSSVPPELLAWWQAVLEHIRAHESQHIRIFQDYVSALPARIVGQPCAAWDAIIGQWSGELTAANSAFDFAEANWQLPAYAGPLGG